MVQKWASRAAVSLAALAIGVGAHAAPIIFWANDPVGPGNAVLVLGSGLTGANVAIEDLTSGRASRLTAPVDQASPTSLKFTIPNGMKPGAYRFVITTPTGRATGLLNTPTVYWVQGDQGASAEPGGWFRIFGRNIARKASARAILTAADGKTLALQPSAYSLWDAKFLVPPTIPPGDYKLALSNGDGGDEAQRDVGAIRISPGARPSNVRIDLRVPGGPGRNGMDDALAINEALRRVSSQGGGVVFLPRGYYRLDSALHIPPGVTLKGEDRRLVHLVWADTATPPPALLDAGSDVVIEDLTLVAERHVHVISAGFPATPGASDGRNITIRRVTIRASAYLGHLSPEQTTDRVKAMLKISSGGGDSIRLAGRNLTVEDCDVLGSGRSLYLLRPSGARVVHNTFQNGRLGWYSISGADGVIFEHNTVLGADLQSTGGGVNTMGTGGAYSRNVLISQNIFERTLGWDGEALTTDGPGGFYYGRARSQAPTTLLLSSGLTIRDRSAVRGAGVFVTGGKGTGEYARVAGIEGDRIRLDRALPVDLDNTSIVAIAPYQANYLFLNNRFTDAGIAAQIFGSSLDHVIAGNISSRTIGFADIGLVYKGVQPSWHTQILDNEIAEGALRSPASIMVWGRQAAPSVTPLVLGTIVRGNKLSGNASIQIKGISQENPAVSDVVIEDNKIERSDLGVIADHGASRVLARNNQILR